MRGFMDNHRQFGGAMGAEDFIAAFKLTQKQIEAIRALAVAGKIPE